MRINFSPVMNTKNISFNALRPKIGNEEALDSSCCYKCQYREKEMRAFEQAVKESQNDPDDVEIVMHSNRFGNFNDGNIYNAGAELINHTTGEHYGYDGYNNPDDGRCILEDYLGYGTVDRRPAQYCLGNIVEKYRQSLNTEQDENN